MPASSIRKINISLKQRRKQVAKLTAQQLHGHLACLGLNVRYGTIDAKLQAALVEASIARADELKAYQLDHQRRPTALDRPREVVVGPHGETLETHELVTEHVKCGGKGQLQRVDTWVLKSKA